MKNSTEMFHLASFHLAFRNFKNVRILIPYFWDSRNSNEERGARGARGACPVWSTPVVVLCPLRTRIDEY